MNYPFWKRIEDIFFGLIGIAVLFILYIPIAILIKIDGPGPIFVRLNRISDGRLIRVYKFRSMIEGAPRMKEKLQHLNERTDGPFFKVRNDPRITTIGRILRKFRVDELPQVINVVKGELSIVGPRPHEPEEVEGYPEEYKNLTDSRGGITGLSQVNGASGLAFLKELELDETYIKKQSLFLDLKIILKTLKILFSDPTAI